MPFDPAHLGARSPGLSDVRPSPSPRPSWTRPSAPWWWGGTPCSPTHRWSTRPLGEAVLFGSVVPLPPVYSVKQSGALFGILRFCGGTGETWAIVYIAVMLPLALRPLPRSLRELPGCFLVATNTDGERWHGRRHALRCSPNSYEAAIAGLPRMGRVPHGTALLSIAARICSLAPHQVPLPRLVAPHLRPSSRGPVDPAPLPRSNAATPRL